VSLRAVLVSVGSEIVLGDLTDTNATWVSRRLAELGVDVVHHLAARDELGELVDALRFAAARAELVIVGGGLGPTVDDLTRDAVAALADVALERREDIEAAIAARFAELGRTMGPANRRQADVPVGARACLPVGTAPSFAVDVEVDADAAVGLPAHRTTLIALPGVPWELHALWERFAADEIVARTGGGAIATRIVHVGGRGESEVSAIVEPLLEGRTDVMLAFLAKAQGIQVRLTAHGTDPADASLAAQPAVDLVVAALGSDVIGVDDDDLDTVVVRSLAAAGRTVATAESAGAGALTARMGRVPGASAVLRGGAIVYATDAKRDVLGVDAALLDAHGPVSAEVTAALAAACRERFDADYGLAVTGVAGPTGVGQVAVGTVFWALAHPDGHVETHTRMLNGDRASVVTRLGTAALDLLRRRLVEADAAGAAPA
jgi:nicotinamide-nucleotide amidase